MDTADTVKSVLGETLQLGQRVHGFDRETPLLGSIPELDSMAVVTVLTALEDTFGIEVEDDEISAETFATLGTLTDYVDSKRTA